MSTGLQMIHELVERTKGIRRAMHSLSIEPNQAKTIDKRYTMKQAETMVGRSYQAIRDAENNGKVPKPDMGPNNRRLGFTLEQINRLRDHFGTRPRREDNEDPIIMAVQNFKGGVGKSTVAVHLAEYLAQSGYRVLLIDCDSQASTTATFGILPDDELEEEDTLQPFFYGDEESIEYAIRKTYWNGLDLIPSNLHLYTAEYRMAEGDWRPEMLLTLRDGIDQIKDNYDVIVIDPPPALGFISLNVLSAANALVIPMPPGMYDFYSTISFLTMLEKMLEALSETIGVDGFKFIKMVITRYSGNISAESEVVDLMEKVFGHHMLSARLKNSAEVKNAGTRLKTVYELKEPITSRDVHKRAVNLFDAVNAEIELLIRKSWPSHARELSAKGLI